jgi:hypothetical protein
MLNAPIMSLLRKIIRKSSTKPRHIKVTDSMWDALYNELKSQEAVDWQRRWTVTCYYNGIVVDGISIVPVGTYTNYSLPEVVA